MHILRHLDSGAPLSPSAVAIGNFDGLHRGHQAVIAAMKAIAARDGLVPTVLTFEPHPRLFFAPHTPPFRLEPLAMKLRRLAQHGVARVVIPRFDTAFAARTPQQFLDDILHKTLRTSAVITGENFAFGAKRAGTSAELQRWGAAQNITIASVPPLTLADGTVVSSTAIRHALATGDMARVAELFGRPYRVRARVVHGDGKGVGLGFPTANMLMPHGVKLPAYGVYAVRVQLGEQRYAAVANFGVKPTVYTRHRPLLEVHLFDFSGSLYGRVMEVEFIEHIRAEKRFASLAELTAAIAQDCIAAKAALQAKV